MQKRWLTLLLVGVLLGVAVWWIMPRQLVNINRDGFDQISVGMSEQEVEAILGGSAGVYASPSTTYAHHPGLERKERICVEWGRALLADCLAVETMVSIQGRKIWYGNQGYITIYFTLDNKVGEKYYVLARHPPSFVEVLRDWFRF